MNKIFFVYLQKIINMKEEIKNLISEDFLNLLNLDPQNGNICVKIFFLIM